MVLVCLPTHTRNPVICFTPLQCEHCTHPTSILLPNGQLSVFTVCEPVLSSSVRALPKATVRAGMVLTGAEYCYRAFSQCLFTVQEWGLLHKSGRRSGFATAYMSYMPRVDKQSARSHCMCMHMHTRRTHAGDQTQLPSQGASGRNARRKVASEWPACVP